MLETKEFYDLMNAFEKSKHIHGYGRRLERETDKALWVKQVYYQNGSINELFIAFMNGYSLAKSMAHQGIFETELQA
jgi:hypothetical protein